MKKSTVIVFLTLIPMMGVSATNGEKQKSARTSGRPVSIVALASAPAFPQGSIAVKNNDPQDSHKVILTLQTRNYLLTIYGGADQIYSVSTQDGVALAEKLDLGELKVRFPELHELLNGSWACDSPIADARF
jgi:hypothetical protein